MKKRYIILTIIAVTSLIATGFLSARLLDKEKVTVSATSIEERLSKCSSLTTARLEYRGMIKYEEGDIPYINKKSFSMIYDAQIKAGIDLSEAKAEITGKKIKVTVPAPEIQDITVNPDSLEFYDEKLALFNWTDREDTANAMEYAKQDAAAKAAQTDILAQASDQAQTVIETLLAPLTDTKDPEYQIEFHETGQ